MHTLMAAETNSHEQEWIKKRVLWITSSPLNLPDISFLKNKGINIYCGCELIQHRFCHVSDNTCWPSSVSIWKECQRFTGFLDALSWNCLFSFQREETVILQMQVSVCLSVQVWELSSGELLLSVLFDVEIMSVTFDPCEYFLFCGGSDGNIFQVSLCSQVSLPLHFTSFI